LTFENFSFLGYLLIVIVIIIDVVSIAVLLARNIDQEFLFIKCPAISGNLLHLLATIQHVL